MIRFPVHFDQPTAFVSCGCRYLILSDETIYCPHHWREVNRRELLAGAIALVGIIGLLIVAAALLEGS